MSISKLMSIQDKQKASLDVLLFLDRFCKQNNIQYYMAYGTLLGAVRHKGFIPWDDDIDVHLPRPDYERLIREFKDPDRNYRIVSCLSDEDYNFPYAKILNMNTASLKWGCLTDKQGIGIDLFPLDGIPDDLVGAKQTFNNTSMKWLRDLYRLIVYEKTNPISLLDCIRFVIGKICYKTGYIKRLAMKYSKSPFSINYNNAKLVGTVVGIYSGNFRVFKKSWFEPYELEFECCKLSAPRDYHKVLSEVYGEYMTLPPKEERVTTHTEEFIWK